MTEDSLESAEAVVSQPWYKAHPHRVVILVFLTTVTILAVDAVVNGPTYDSYDPFCTDLAGDEIPCEPLE